MNVLRQSGPPKADQGATSARRASVRGRSLLHPPKADGSVGFFPLLACLAAALADPQASLWSNDFERVEVGAEPDGVLVLNGEFTVREDGDNRVLALPGAPLETMGLLVGPSRREGVSVTARIRGERKGRQSPSFGVGLCGAKGFRLMVAPMRDALELSRDEEVIARAPFKWKPGEWTHLRLAVVRDAGGWKVCGRAWAHGEEEPKGWAVEVAVAAEPPNGAASLWGLPYSGKPILYDDVAYAEVAK